MRAGIIESGSASFGQLRKLAASINSGKLSRKSIYTRVTEAMALPTSSKPENIPLTASQLTPVLPLRTPPASNWPPPTLPPLNPTSETSKHWTVTRHVFPAAYPRSRAGCYVDSAPQEEKVEAGNAARAGRDQLAAKVESMKRTQYEAPLQGELEKGHLWIAANCYRRKAASRSPAAGQNRPATTLVLVHATGLHKEVRV